MSECLFTRSSTWSSVCAHYPWIGGCMCLCAYMCQLVSYSIVSILQCHIVLYLYFSQTLLQRFSCLRPHYFYIKWIWQRLLVLAPGSWCTHSDRLPVLRLDLTGPSKQGCTDRYTFKMMQGQNSPRLHVYSVLWSVLYGQCSIEGLQLMYDASWRPCWNPTAFILKTTTAW